MSRVKRKPALDCQKGEKSPTVLVPVRNRYSPVFPSTTEWQQLEFMKHACALQVFCFYIQDREKMSLLCSVCQAASSFVPKYAPCHAKNLFLNYIPKGELDMCKSNFSFKQYTTPVWDVWPSDGEKFKSACAIPTWVPALRNIRQMLITHVMVSALSHAWVDRKFHFDGYCSGQYNWKWN